MLPVDYVEDPVFGPSDILVLLVLGVEDEGAGVVILAGFEEV